MNQAVRETVDVHQLWQKKAEAVHTIYLLTLEQSKACAAEDMKRLNELLEQRQKWMDQVDTLDAWLADLGAKETAGGAQQEQVNELLKKFSRLTNIIIGLRRKSWRILKPVSAITAGCGRACALISREGPSGRHVL